jgi:heme/copper-type cytochrome/quinol oxidase subunit 2
MNIMISTNTITVIIVTINITIIITITITVTITITIIAVTVAALYDRRKGRQHPKPEGPAPAQWPAGGPRGRIRART